MGDKELARSMQLPEGKTCSDCAHFGFCEKFIGLKGDEKTCDWAPSRFYLKTLVPTQPTATASAQQP